MGLFKWKKKKQTEQAEDKSVPAFWKAEKIDANDVLLSVSTSFLEGAVTFYNDIREAKKSIADHNAVNENDKKTIERIVSGEEYPEKNLDIMLLSFHKRHYEDRVALDMSRRNSMNIVMGFIQLECLRQCEMLRPDATLDTSKENLLAYCSMEAIEESALENLKKSELKGFVYDLPTADELSFYYDVCAQYQKLFHEEEDPKAEGKISDMFTPNGLIQLPDEDGQYHLVEEDFLAAYVEIDYKGVV